MAIREDPQNVFGRRAASYVSSATHTDPRVLARVVALARPSPEAVALDVGTGTGHTAFALAPHVRRIVGADLTFEMLSEARALRHERGIDNTALVMADVHSMPFPDGAFDVVTCRRAAHHFRDIDRAVSEMCRVLRHGGRLVVDDRSVPDDSFVDQCMNELDRLHDPSHVRQYPPGEWRRMLEAAGLVVESVEPYTLHRPLTSLTGNAAPQDVVSIHRLLDSLNEGQRAALDLKDVDGQMRLNHWYVMVAASRP
jgi:ubiquinone/menaquinone biosynthesis C-methylase UbiE